MIPPRCDYYRAGSVEEALELLQTHDDREPALLAGGHGLVPDMKVGRASPDVLVDIRSVDGLASIEVDDDRVTVGALVTHASLADSDALRTHAPALADAAAEVADVQIRNRGTIGGNLAEADPAADLPPAALASAAEMAVRGPTGARTVDAAEFFRGAGETALESTEVLTRVHLPWAPGGAYVRKTHPASGYASVSVAATLEVPNGSVTNPRVAAGGVTDRPVRLKSVESALAGGGTDEAAIRAAAERASEDLGGRDLRGDALASAEYRRGILPSYVERAVGTAIQRAGGTGRD